MLALLLAAIAISAPPEILSEQARPTPLVSDLPGAGAIAVKPTGQSLLVVDEAARTVQMVELSNPVKRFTAVSAFGPGEHPVAVGCIDSVTVVVVVRSARDWSLRSFRLGPPGEATDAAAPAQVVSLGVAAEHEPADGGKGSRPVGLVVSPSRNWLVVCGLPAPMAAVVRAPIAGSRIGAVTTRNCPAIERSSTAPVAVVSPNDELVILRPDLLPGSDAAAGLAVLTMYSPVGARRLLELDTGLPAIRGACYARECLWVLGGDPADSRRPEGLWRLDAAMGDRRSCIRPSCVAQIASPIAMVPLSGNRIVVVHGGADARTISVVEP